MGISGSLDVVGELLVISLESNQAHDKDMDVPELLLPNGADAQPRSQELCHKYLVPWCRVWQTRVLWQKDKDILWG